MHDNINFSKVTQLIDKMANNKVPHNNHLSVEFILEKRAQTIE